MNNLNKYNDLELSILSCLLLKPELMKDLTLEDKYFTKHQRLWQFMKSFYNKFKTFDCVLMCEVCKDKYRLMDSIVWLLETEPIPDNFYKYQKELIEIYNELEKDKWIRNKVYELANELLVRNITTKEFGLKVNEIYKNANEIFKKEDD